MNQRDGATYHILVTYHIWDMDYKPFKGHLALKEKVSIGGWMVSNPYHIEDYCHYSPFQLGFPSHLSGVFGYWVEWGTFPLCKACI